MNIPGASDQTNANRSTADSFISKV